MPLVLRFLTVLFISLTFTLAGNSQIIGPPSSDAEYEKDYTWRIRQERLFGTYIPANLPEAIQELIKKMPEGGKEKFMTLPEDLVIEKLYFSLGRWITHNWSLYEGSRLGEHFRQKGISYPEDMANIIMVLTHRTLLEQDLLVKELLESYQNKQKSRVQNRIQEGEVLMDEKRVVPPTRRD